MCFSESEYLILQGYFIVDEKTIRYGHNKEIYMLYFYIRGHLGCVYIFYTYLLITSSNTWKR